MINAIHISNWYLSELLANPKKKQVKNHAIINIKKAEILIVKNFKFLFII